MEVILAEKAGFCFGVKRAVDTAFAKADEFKNTGRRLYTYGPIIHNEEVIKKLEDSGVYMLESLDKLEEIPEGSAVIIRSHGVPKADYDRIEKAGLEAIDTTCPFVQNIHKIVSERSVAGDTILIIGNPGHAEVDGTIGWSVSTPYVINSTEDIEALPDFGDANITVVAQTTYSLKKFQELVETLKDRYYNVNVCKTICNATEERQREAEKLASTVDAMVVIGGKSSSNTQKLYEISKQACNNTYYIQTLVDLDLTVFESASRVGITAGASTPNYIIKEVQDSMSEMNSMEDWLDESNSFNPRKGQVVEGSVIWVKPDEMAVDIHCKADGILKADEYSNMPVDLTTVFKENDPVTVMVLSPKDSEGNVILSCKSIMADEAYKELQEAFENKTVLTGKVIEIRKGGLIVLVKECRVFIPISLVSDRFERDINKYEGQELEFILTECDMHKKRFIGNRKQLLVEKKAADTEKLLSSLEVGQVVEGDIKNITDFGAFVDLGLADGLLHISEMSWGRVDKPKKIFNVGDHVRCFVKEINGDKIALSCKFEDENPWLKAEEKYAKGTVVTGKVARMTDFGAFVVLEPGIDALLHVSQISQDRIEKPSDVLKSGQEIEAKVVDIKVDDKKISLSMKALLPEKPKAEEKAEEKEDKVVIPESEDIAETIPVDDALAAAVAENAPAEDAE